MIYCLAQLIVPQLLSSRCYHEIPASDLQSEAWEGLCFHSYNSVLDFTAMLQFFLRRLSALQALTTMALLATGFVYGDSSVVALGCYPEIVLVYFNILTLLAIHPYLHVQLFSLVTWPF